MMMFDELARQAYTNKHGMASFWIENYLCISISDPVTASVVLKTFSDKWPITLPMRHLIGNGSVFGEEEIWRLRRKILIPVFNSKYCDNFVKIFERNNKVLMEKLTSVVGKGDFSTWEYFSAYTLDSAFDMTFGENLEVQKNPNHPFAVAFQDYFKHGAARVCQPWLYCNALYELTPAGAKQNRNKKVIWDCVENLIKKKKTLSKGPLESTTEHDTKNTHDEQFKSFLDLLIEFSGGEAGYTDTELREETLVLILAATDSTATALCLATVMLANHPEVQDKVYQEIKEVLGDSERSLDNLAKLKYLDAVVKETMRLYPPAPVTVRRCNKDLELPSGLVLNEGCYFLLNFWGVHRNPGCWGADADEFKPERFLSATPDQLAAFMPFGHGPRSCTGLQLALTSIKFSLVELTRRYRLAPAASYEYSPKTPLRVTFDIMLKHVHQFKVQLENRH
ncbi:cytochrome P450 4d2-like [Maniola jurtina]|uniref:cytochrome P450 4d2-like n=1 Tax=Maniola jurtina TaxID=191418 RepID=UPI001E689D7C|nr:cytochrome P450 4d2-like [Maniola jurtina]